MSDSAITANGSGHGSSSTSTARTSSRPPTLSDIAAHMKIGSSSSSSASGSSPVIESSASHLDAPSKGRLGLAGRLNSATASPELGELALRPDTSSPQLIARGGPSYSSNGNLAPDSNSSSPAIGGQESSGRISPSLASTRNKALPTLEDIRNKLSQKGHGTSMLPAKAPSVSSPETSATATTSGWDTPPTASSSSSSSVLISSGVPATTSTSPQDVPSWRKTSPTLASTSTMGPPASTQPLGGKAFSKSLSNRRASSSTSTSTLGAAIKATAQPASSRPRKTPGEHPLQHQWSLFFDSKSFNPSLAAPNVDKPWLTHPLPNKESGPSTTPAPPKGGHASQEHWEAALKKVGDYSSVEGFMSVFASIRRPSTLEKQSNYHLFKDGIKPMWEDPANAKGGKWVVSFQKGATSSALLDRTWVWLVCALIGEELDLDNDVCGAVVSTRPKADRIALWIKIKDDVTRVNELGHKLIELLDLEKEPGVSLEFSPNDTGSFGRGSRSGGASHGYWAFNNRPSSPTIASTGSTAGSSSASKPPPSGSGGGIGLGLGTPIGRTTGSQGILGSGAPTSRLGGLSGTTVGSAKKGW